MSESKLFIPFNTELANLFKIRELLLLSFIIFCVRKPRGLQPRGGITPSIFIIIIHLNLLLFNIIYYLYIGNSPNELTKQRNYDI